MYNESWLLADAIRNKHTADALSSTNVTFAAPHSERDEISEIFPRRLEEAKSKLLELLKLPENWDSYGAHPIKLEAAVAAFELIALLMEDQTPMPSIIPTPKGNIQLEWHTRGIDLEIEVVSSTLLHVYYEDIVKNEEKENTLHTDLRELTKLITRLSERS